MIELRKTCPNIQDVQNSGNINKTLSSGFYQSRRAHKICCRVDSLTDDISHLNGFHELSPKKGPLYMALLDARAAFDVDSHQSVLIMNGSRDHHGG